MSGALEGDYSFDGTAGEPAETPYASEAPFVWPMPISFINPGDKLSKTLFAVTQEGLVLVVDVPRADPGVRDALWVREDGVFCVSRGTV